MRWLKPLFARASTRLENESGVTIIFIAVILLGLLAMTAFVIDFGRIWQERRELQAGATAAALAVGEDCARDLCDAAYNESLVADLYADANATDGAATIHGIALDLTAQTVEVVTATEEPDGSASMDMFFARIVGFDTITVGAGAIVAWGNPQLVTTIPLIISDCEWLRDPALFPGWPGGDPDNLPTYDPSIPLADYDPATMVMLILHDTTGAEECNSLPGHDVGGDGKLPGGFGWLDTGGSCIPRVRDGWVAEDPGASPSTGCSASEVETLMFDSGPVFIPYFSDIDIIPGADLYEISGYGAFVVGGYNFTGQYKEYRAPLTDLPCGGSTHCVSGWFVQHVDNGGSGGPLGGVDRGIIVIQLIA